MIRPVAAAGVVSLLLHGAAFWMLLPHSGGASPTPAQLSPIEVELVDRAETQRGAAATPEGAPPGSPPVPEVPRGNGDLPPAPPPSPATPAPPGPVSRPAVNLGGDQQDQEALTFTAQNIVPPRTDSRFRNQPPSYPVDAARRGAEGIVRVMVHISVAGVPSAVEVVMSSGDASLDRAAVDAVALWRFNPARNGGAPVPFDYTLEINFRR